MAPAPFQEFCDTLLHKKGYGIVHGYGMMAGSGKTTIGNPDTYFRKENGKYVFVAYTTQVESIYSKLKDDIDIKEYDTIFVGYPNWWGTMPMPVWTFLEEKDFTNKKVLPFCTHEGSGLGKSQSDIKKLTGGAEVLKGLAINGSEVSNSEKQIKKWLEDSLI